MGFYIEYENNIIEVWACDTCNKHLIVVDKTTKLEYWLGQSTRNENQVK